MAAPEPILPEPPASNRGNDRSRVLYNFFLLVLGKYPGYSGVKIEAPEGGLQVNEVQGGAVNTPAIQSDATAAAENLNRKLLRIQNHGTNPLRVRFAAGASSTVFHVILKGATAEDDGTGGSVEISGAEYKGIVTVDGTDPRYTVTEINNA